MASTSAAAELAAGGDPAPAGVTATSDVAKEHRLRGNAHWQAGRVDDAAAAYGEAIAAAGAQLGASAGAARGDATRELVQSLTNRARCALRQRRLSAALDDTWAAAEACLTASGPRRRKLRSGDGWGWAAEAYLKAVVLRARAAREAGVPLIAHTHTDCASTLSPELRASDAFMELEEATRLMTFHDGHPDRDAPRDCVVDGAWSKLSATAGAPAPSPRRAAAAAVVAGYLHVFGGENKSASPRTAPHPRPGELRDAWRAKLCLAGAESSAPLVWEALPTPSAHGGPPSSVCPHGAACDELTLFVVAARGALWALSAGADTDGRGWRALGPLWPRGDDPAAAATLQNDPDYALAVCGTAAYVVRAGESVVRISLLDGARSRLLHGGADKGPLRDTPLLWPAAGCNDEAARLRLWGGKLPTNSEEVFDPPRGTDMLHYHRGGWRVEPRGGGGGAVPLLRDETAVAPLPRGGALLFGGFTDRCSYIRQGSAGGTRFAIEASRLLNDAHLYDEDAGWRAVRAAGEPPQQRAQQCVVFDPPSGAILVFGGWCDGQTPNATGGGTDTAHLSVQNFTTSNAHCTLRDVYALRVDGVTSAGVAAPAPATPAANTAEQPPAGCDHCGAAAAAGSRLARCARCRAARYCSPACQAAAWPRHKAQCAPKA